MLADGWLASPGHPSIWTVSVLSGNARMLRDHATTLSVSPIDSRIAFEGPPFGSLGALELWIMGSGGEEAQKILGVDANSGLGSVTFSPNGLRLAYFRAHQAPRGLEVFLESRDLKGENPVLTLSDPKLLLLTGICWLPDSRIIYARQEPAPNEGDTNLWEIYVDATGKPKSKPRRITDWSGSVQGNLRTTLDGKRLAFSKQTGHGSIYVGELGANGAHLKVPRRLTLSEDTSYPFAWTSDSRTILFASDRNGRWEIFKQSLDEESAELLVTDLANDLSEPSLSPDHSWVVYAAFPKSQGGIYTTASQNPVNLVRLAVSGGPPQVVLTSRGYVGQHCAQSAATLCLLAEESPDRKQLAFIAFDPLGGRGRELVRIDTQPDLPHPWSLSADGSRLAIYGEQ